MTEPSYQIGMDWTDVEALTGIEQVSELIIQNQGRAGDIIECAIDSVQPDYAGVSISQFTAKRITPDEKVWIRYVRYDIQPGSYENQDRKCKVKILSNSQIQDVSAINYDLISGNSAITVQGFSELNSKDGKQYEVAMLFEDISGGSSAYFGLETSDLMVIVKQRDVYGDYVTATYEVFSTADYAGGTTIDSFNNNDLVINPANAVITQSPVVSDEGLKFSVTTNLLGAEGSGNKAITSFGAQAGEEILKPNTKYLVKITNTNNSAIDALAVRLYYYEGPISSRL